MGDGPNPIRASGNVPVTILPPADVRSESSVAGSENWAVVAGGFLAAAALALLFRGRSRARVREEVEVRPRMAEVPFGRVGEIASRWTSPVRPAFPGGMNPFTALRTTGTTAATATALAGCGGGEEPDSITPLDPPSSDDTTVPDTPRNNFDQCLPPTESFMVMVEGEGAFYGANAPIEGCFLMSVDRQSICVQGESCYQGIPQTGDRMGFTAVGRWASTPTEFYEQDPGDPGYGLMAVRTNERAMGNALSRLRRDGMTGSWADQFPGFVDRDFIGFIWPIEGVVDLTNCHVTMTFRATVMTPDGIGETLDYTPLPFYANREDGLSCVAEGNFSNEVLVIRDDPSEASFGESEAVTTVCSGDDCTDVNGASNPQDIRMTLIREER